MSTTTFYCHLHMTFCILDYILKDCFVHMYIAKSLFDIKMDSKYCCNVS